MVLKHKICTLKNLHRSSLWQSVCPVVADGDWSEEDGSTGKSKYILNNEARWAELKQFLGPGNPITEDGLVRFFEHLRTGEGLEPYPLMAYIRAISAMGKRQERIVLIYKMPGVADFIKRHIPKANLFFPTHTLL